MSAITITDLHQIIQQLANERPIFHSEADVQHALAWAIHETYPDCRVRLEVNPYTDGQSAHLDVICYVDELTIAIELKYKTRKLDSVHSGETFHLREQSAQDGGRYDFIKDICRLERFVLAHPQSLGFVVLLTNDATYWRPANPQSAAASDQFRLHDNAILKGSLQWAEHASDGTRKTREQPLKLINEYIMHWHDYSKVAETSKGRFRYLLLAILNDTTPKLVVP